MRIFLKRTGGFTGVPLSVTVDTSTLPSAEATHLRELLEAADFFQLPTRFPATPQPDRFQYQITVEDADRSHSVTVGETAVPPTLKPLLNGVMDAGQQP